MREKAICEREERQRFFSFFVELSDAENDFCFAIQPSFLGTGNHFLSTCIF